MILLVIAINEIKVPKTRVYGNCSTNNKPPNGVDLVAVLR